MKKKIQKQLIGDLYVNELGQLIRPINVIMYIHIEAIRQFIGNELWFEGKTKLW